MYHGRFQNSHYEAGFRWGRALYQHGKIITDIPTFQITEERRAFAGECLPVYEKYYPEVLEEIRGLADGQKGSYEDFCIFLLSMYCFAFQNHCTCFAFRDENQIILGRNSDFLVKLEKLYMNCLYRLNGVYGFNGNTTAFIEMEDGINEHGLAVGLTFLYPKVKKPGFNAGMLVRFLLEKCKTTGEAIENLKKLPIASQQTLTVADSTGQIAVAECNCEEVKIITPQERENFVISSNLFASREMKRYNISGQGSDPQIDDWRAAERYAVASRALKKNQDRFSVETAADILSGKYGFMCQYDRKTGADTVWSVIYDSKNKQIYRAEGNPSRKKFREDVRLKFQ